MPCEDAPTVTDAEVRAAIRAAKRLGTRVCLKPVVNCADGTWRAYIGFFDTDVPGEPSWAQWFASYERFLLRYARIAQEDADVKVVCDGFRAWSAESSTARKARLYRCSPRG